MKTYVVGTHLKHLSDVLLMCTTTYVFMEKLKKMPGICTFWLKKKVLYSDLKLYIP